MKRFFTIICSAAFPIISFTSIACAATTDLQPVASASATRISGSLIPLSPLMEEYSWLFWPGLIAAGVVIVLIISIIRDRRRRGRH